MRRYLICIKLFFVGFTVLVLGLTNNSLAATTTISYGAQVYTQGTSVGTVSPTTGGGAVGTFGYSTTVTTTYNTGNGPNNMTFDAAGNLYVTNGNSNTVSKITPGGTISTFINTNLNNPQGIAFDASGNAYVVNNATGGNTGTVTKYSSTGTYLGTVITGGNLFGIDIDASGNIWIADQANGLKEYSSTGTLIQTVTSNISGASDVFIDGNGFIYVANAGGNNITKYSSAGAYLATVGTGLSAPYAVYVDGSGNIYAASSGVNSAKIYNSSGTLITTFAGGSLNEPSGIITDASGNLYISSYGSNRVYKYTPTGGYFINAPLPAGLSFNYTNGQITGTPTTPAGITSYTVTAYGTGTATSTFNVTVNPPAPTTTGGSTCGTGAVTLTAGGETTTGGTYNWYTASTGGTAVYSSTSTTYSPTISATTTYYVSYTVNGATSASRTSVTATYNAEPILSTAPTGTGLTFSYPFPNNTNDVSSANNNGTIYTGNVTPTTDRYGAPNSAYAFTGNSNASANGYIYTNNGGAITAPTNYSVNIWFSTTTPGGLLIGFGATKNGANSSTHDRKIYMTNSGQIVFGTYNTAPDTLCTPSGTNYADGNWHMVTGVFSPTTGMTLYVDGKEISTNANFKTAQSYTGYWRIGNDNLSGWPSASTNNYFNGSLDDICVYTSTITPATIYTLYGAGSFAACIGAPLSLQANTVSGATYSWSGPNGYSSSVQNPVVDPAASTSDLGTYVLTVTGSNGCQYQQNVTPQLYGEPAPAFTATSSVATGANATITYSATVVAGDTYSWDFGGGTPSTGTGQGPFTVKWTTAGAKTVTLTETNANSCSNTYTQSVIVGGQSVTAGNYAFSQNVALNTSAITGGITTTLSNFPALVYIQENALIVNGSSACATNLKFPTGGTNGYDFAFTMQGSTTELYYQVESYDPTTGTLLAWVNIPQVTSTNTALTFYFASTTPNHPTAFTQNTWASDYAAVYHFDEGAISSTTGYVVDATSNGKNATQSATGVTLGAGEVRSAAGITAATSAYVFKGAGSLTVSSGINIPNTFTLSAWINLNSIPHDQKVMTNQTTSVGGYKLGVYSNNIPESETTGAVNRGYSPVAPAIGTSAWHYVQSVFDGTKIVTYVDGGEYQVESTTSNSSSTNPFYIGVGESGNNYYFNGTISEARVSSLAKSSDWINCEYYNQTNPKTFTIVSTTISAVLTSGFAVNAQAIGASIQYNWLGGSTDVTNAANWYCAGAATTSGTTSGSLNIVPPQDGSSSLNIPTSTNYPVLPYYGVALNEPIYGLTLGAGAQIYLNGNTLSIGCHIYNNGTPGGIISSGSSSSSTVTPATTGGIIFTGAGILSGQPQYFYGSTTSTVNLANLTESNAASAGSLSITGGPANIYGSLSTTSGNISVATSSTVTLVSTASGTANVLKIPSANTISGSVTAQRYFPGGTGYRSYRLVTLPININSSTNQSTTEAFIDLHSLNTGLLTAGPGTGFSYATATKNPLMYLYDESRAQNFTTYLAGKNVGIYAMTGSTTYKVTYYGAGVTAATVPTTTAQVPVGNSVQVYYVGPSSATNLTATAPAAAISTVTGYLNQGTIPTYIFSTGTTSLSYNPATNNTPAKGPGLNQVGNPYASTIDLDSVYFDNKTGTAAIGPAFWELKQPNNTFVAYMANHTTSSTGAEAYIASGEGFYAQAIATTSKLTFYENEKVNVNIGTATTPVLILNQRNPNSTSAAIMEPTSSLAGMHLQMTQDSINNTQTGIYFNASWNDKYSPMEDAIDLDGPSPKVYLSSYSSDGARLSINGQADYTTTARKTVKIYASAIASGTYTISLADINNIDALYSVYLRDHKLNDSVDLRTAGSYSFTINTGDTTSFGANRFDVVLERMAVPPYQLLTFTGQKVTQGVLLNWSAANPGNYTGYTLQKKNADGTFSPIYTTQSNNSSTYNFTDTNPIIGNNIYRLSQNDINGNVTYSSLITIGYNNVSSNGYFSVYPNPAKDMINILVNSPTTANEPANYTADIYNTSGTLMDHRTLNTYSWTEDVSSYKEGVYIIALKNTNGVVLAKSKFIKVQ